MSSVGPRYATSAAFVRALDHQLRVAAVSAGRPVEELRRQFLTHRLLARVFLRPDSGWVLMGGVGMLVRVPGARATRDVDLMHTYGTVEQAIGELDGLLLTPHLDPFTFQRSAARTMTGRTDGAQLSVTALAGASRVGTFPIDLTTNRTPLARTQLLRPRPVIDIDDVSPLPEFLLYPLEDQVADKICAMFGRYGTVGSPSTRFHDLVDLVLITRGLSVDATGTRAAIESEQHRRGVTVPGDVPSPGPTWGAGYRAVAARSTLPPDLHHLENALAAIRPLVRPLLTGGGLSGRWDPARQRWT